MEEKKETMEMEERFTILCVSIPAHDKWHMRITGTAIVKGKFVSFNKNQYLLLSVCEGLDSTCKVLAVIDSNQIVYRLYTDIQTKGYTKDEVLGIAESVMG